MIPVQAIAMNDELIQYATLLLVLFGAGLEIYQWIKEPSEWYWLGGNLFWMVHGIFFYIFLTLDRYTTIIMHPFFGSYTLWSGVLRFQIIGTMIVIEWTRIRQQYLRKIKKSLSEKLVLLNELEINKTLVMENHKLLEDIKNTLESEEKNK